MPSDLSPHARFQGDPFDRIVVHQTAEVTHTLTAADVDAFAHLTGDYNPLHLNAAFAARASFQRPVVHGMLSASFISRLIGMALPGEGALWLSQSINFHMPAYVGDTVTVRGTVRHLSPSTRVIVLDLLITNQHDEQLISGEATVMLPLIQNSVSVASTQVTFITGGNRGIGASIARRLAADSKPVAIIYHSGEEQAAALVQSISGEGGRALALRADLRDPEMVAMVIDEVRERLGPIEAFVHSAAPPNPPASFLNRDPGALREQLDIQVHGAECCCRAVLPGMVARGTGAIVFIGSIAAEGQPPPLQTDYVVAKAALAALSRCLAGEFGPKGIRVNVVAPGMTRTERIHTMPEKAKLLARMQAPLRRLAEADDVAGAVAFLLSPDARHITGVTLPVCGGVWMG
ncbi:MAG: SDR family oxidoreductase [Cyanobacteriota bacterium]|nr:SDR family oxidoreductase [Cyanobacteriota bacterium]